MNNDANLKPWDRLLLTALLCGLPLAAVQAQPAEQPPPATPAPGTTAPTEVVPGGTQPAPPTVGPAPAAPPPAVAPAPEPLPTPPEPEVVTEAPVEVPAEAAPKPISIAAWGRVGLRLHGTDDPEKPDHLSEDGVLELHFDGQATDEIGLTGNIAGNFGPTSGPGGTPDIQGTVTLEDVITRFDIHDAFHVWGGRMLVPSDRANFSGTWFEAPWYYPGTFSSNGFMGPREGPYGRNDGLTVWGQVQGGLFKYYASAFDLWNPGLKPLWSGRLNLSLLSPEPGYYNSSTYYGKDILAIGIGGQVQNDGSTFTPMGAMAPLVDDYALFNADVLFEKNFDTAGVLDLEGAFYKYFGDNEAYKFSYLLLASWLTPEPVGPGKIQPLVRFQQGKVGDINPASGSDTSVEIQVGYVIAAYAARLALGYQFTKTAALPDDVKAHAIYLGAQVMK